MRKNRGITLISLVSSVILILILAGITVVTSMNSYNQMKFEGAKAEIEQVEKLVDEIASDYQTYLTEQNDSSLEYKQYFNYRYNNNNATNDFEKKLLSQNQDKAKTIIAKYTELSLLSNNMFYFSQDDLNKYFDLKGINDVVIDFSTRKVYSVEGIKDPDDKDKLYFISSEWGGDTRVSSTANTPTTVNASSFTSTKSGSYYNVTIILDKVIDVSEVYAKVNDKTIKRDEFRVSKTATNTTVYFTVESTGTYTFRFVDSSKRVYEITGKTIS